MIEATEHEHRARAVKVQQLVEALTQANATCGALRHFTDSAWQLAAQCANVNPPSEQTIALVIRTFELRERTASDDPFVGLDEVAA